MANKPRPTNQRALANSQTNPNARSLQSSATVYTQQLQYNSPLPPPEIMAQYEALLPGATDRILTLLEDQTHHRQSLETKTIDNDIKQSRRGWITTSALGSGGIIVSGILAYTIQGWQAAEVVSSVFLVVGGLNVWGNIKRRQERSKKLQAVERDEAKEGRR